MRIIFLLASLWMSSAWALTPDFTAYFRAASGSNARGGAMECFNNKGAATGNEFRLGNECGIYGEFQFGANLLKADNDQAPFWRMASNFAFVYDNRTDFETTTTSPNNWVLRELYTEGGNFDGLNFTVWAGKRFYRWGAMHMDDFYPVDMNGPGGGIGGIKTSLGTWAFAVIQDSESKEFPGNGTAVTTNNGRSAKTSVHLRLEEIASNIGTWAVWLSGATTPSTTATASGMDYKSSSGAMLAVKNDWKVGIGANELGVAVGSGNLSNLTSRGDLVRDCNNGLDANCTVQKSMRTRVWEGYKFDMDKWSAEVALIYDDFNSGADTDSHIRWTSLGVRPIYWFTDHLSVAFEGGISNVVDEGDGLGSRNLIRTTIAPQLSFGKEYASRPVIRAFYTRNSWNENNKVSFAGTTAAQDTEAQTMGLQTEIWF